MGFRFRKSVKLFPGARLNISKSGFSVSLGAPGATFNFGPRGSSVTVGLPGSGLSYRHQLSSKPKSAGATAHFSPSQTPDQPQVEPFEPAGALPGEIRSREVARLSSPDLEGFKRMINEAAAERKALKPEIDRALRERLRTWRRLRRSEQPPLRMFVGRKTPQYRAEFEETEAEALKALAARAGTRIRVQAMFDEATSAAYEALRKAHASLATADSVWDVTSSVNVDRYATRSAANQAVTRTRVALGDAVADIVANDQTGMRLDNANGGDLEIFTCFMLIREKSSSDFALLDLRQVNVECRETEFIEDERVPSDAPVVGRAWEKSNKDGSRDRRFNNNREIPVVRYGRLDFSSSSGLNEAYLVSSYTKASGFARAWRDMQTALRQLADRPQRPADDVLPPSIDISGDLPELPAVGGAHELTAAAGLVVVALGGFAFSQSRAPQAPVSVMEKSLATRERAAEIAPGVPSTLTFTPEPELTPAASPALPPTPPFSPPSENLAAGVEHMTTTAAANLRREPSRSSPVTRILAAKVDVRVFSVRGEWLQVGAAGSPEGWVHRSLLKPAAKL